VKLAYLPSFATLSFQNGQEYHNVNGRNNSADDWPILCRNLVSFDPVTHEEAKVCLPKGQLSYCIFHQICQNVLDRSLPYFPDW